MKPTFDLGKGTYFGGKGAAGVVHTIINQMPAHNTFISGFLGKCAVMRWKHPAKQNIGIDLDSGLIAEWRESIRNNVSLELIETSFLSWKGQPLDLSDSFLYLDPPYLPETRSGSNKYKFELTIANHVELLEKASSLPCMVAISCYDSTLYRKKLKDWRKIQFNSQTRGGTRVETLYMNYPEPIPQKLHDTRFLGTNFRDRERGKRRIETIKRKIERLEPKEKAPQQSTLRGFLLKNPLPGLRKRAT